MKQGVIFDMDGVLVASGPAHRESWRILARQHGIEITDEQFSRLFGQTSRDIICTLWGDDLSDDEIRSYDDEKERIYRDLIASSVPVAVGAPELLVVLSRAGFVLAVATSGPPENLDLVLRETHLGGYFAATVHGFDIRRGKPAPDCFLLAAQRAGLPPAGCVVVEDAPVGIEAALAAGMKAIGLVGTHPGERLYAVGASRVVERLGEITPAMLTELLKARRSGRPPRRP